MSSTARRAFAGFIAALLLASPAARASANDLAPSPHLKEAKPSIGRIIYNDDGGALKNMRKADLKDYCSRRLKGLAGTQVDAVFFCTHDDWTRVFYQSKIEGVEFVGSQELTKLMAQGIDPIEESIAFCRRSGMKVFHSFRMNDVHDSFSGSVGKLKRDHPEWLLGSMKADYPAADKERRTRKEANWSSLDFAQAPVRDLVLRSIEEVMNRWEWDGLEFDYGRNACLFKAVFQGGAATDEDRGTLLDMHRTIRKMTRAHAAKRGKPFALAVVAPETPALAKTVGIDLQRWLDEDLVDAVIAGNGYIPFSPRALDLIEMGRRYGVPVHLRLNANTGGAERPFHHRMEAWRGWAANAWAAGACGVYVFNAYDRERFSPKALDLYHEIGDPHVVARGDRLYLVDWDFSRWGYGGADVAFYMPLENLLPMPLGEKDRCVEFTCMEGAAAVAGSSGVREIQLRLGVEGLAAGDACAFTLNGNALPAPSAEKDEAGVHVFEYALHGRELRRGANRIEAKYRADSRSPGAAALKNVELWVRRER